MLRPTIQSGPDAGLPNPLYARLLEAVLVKLAGAAVGSGEIDDLIPADDLSLAELNTVLTLGGEIYDYPAFIEIPHANRNDNVPSYLTGATDDDGNPVSWVEWFGPNSGAQRYGDNWLAELSALGRSVPGSQLKQLVAGGFNVMTRKQAVQYIADNN